MLNIRRLEPKDFSIWKTLRLESMVTEPNQFESTEFGFTDQEWKVYLNENICFIAFENNIPVGCSSVLTLKEEPKKHLAYIFGIYVKYEYRRKGIMTKMLHEVVQHVKSIGIEQLHLTVATGNEKAVAGYKKYGFNVYGIQNKALKYGDKYVDEYMMVKHI